MKFSFEYVKKNPVMFGAIVIVFGLLFWVFLNRGASRGGGTTVVQSGLSDAATAAALQAHMAELAAGAQTQQIQGQVAVATIQANNELQLGTMAAQIQANGQALDAANASKSIDASLLALKYQLDNNLNITDSNNNFMLNYAVAQQQAAVQQVAINASLQRDLSSQQLEAFRIGTLSSLATSLKSKGLAGHIMDLSYGASGGYNTLIVPPLGMSALPPNSTGTAIQTSHG